MSYRMDGKTPRRRIGSFRQANSGDGPGGEGPSLSGPVRTHGLRHIAPTEVLDHNGGDIRAAQEFARYLAPRTTLLSDRNRRDLAGARAKSIAQESAGVRGNGRYRGGCRCLR